MSAFLSIRPQTLTPSPFTDRTRALNPFRRKRQDLFRSNLRIGDLAVVKFGFRQGFPETELAQGVVKEMLDRAESFIYTIADAAVSADSTNVSKQSSDWLSGITNYLETVLKILKDGLSALHVPYSYGFAIILLTIIVKAVTFPLSKKQVESTLAMRSLQPQIQAINKRYAGDQERIQLETARLYKLAGVNPVAGCLPTLVTIPVWIGLYRALSNVANEGLLTEGFFWIPSLSGPTTIAAQQSGSRTSWLFPFVDGHPPLGWSDTLAYLVLPVLLIVSQYISIQIMQGSQSKDSKQNSALTNFLPLMIGYFALSVPSGLSLYWLTNNILSTAQQIWLQKLGGAKNPVLQYLDEKNAAEQPAKVQKSMPEAESGKEKSKLGEKSASGELEKNAAEQLAKVQKSMPEAESVNEKSKLGEKSASGELPRGERFKQIKEQEAKRRQHKEEEKRRAEMTARSANLVDEGNPKDLGSSMTQEETTRHSLVNGAHLAQDSEKEKADILPDITNDGVGSMNGIVMNEEKSSSENLKTETKVQHVSVDPSVDRERNNDTNKD
ncbi:ALBINO3-like protein 1, chloroplastic isoform X2 [Aristolochia californica]|uniref:ALBINO3-like protein 1, chloroplastic isoform X2 n=1 Tax=Aristolochia californica TaxID=171875 RepID=UPI0035D7ABB2